jgi:hypothetical protein
MQPCASRPGLAATLADNPRKNGQSNLIAPYGATENRHRSFVFRGSK